MSARISFRQLEVFLETVEAGSFRACADRLEISQASVSNHIRALEEHMGGPLFLRRRGTVASLTERGGRVYREVRDLLDRANRLGLGAAPLRPATRRTVVIGAHGLPARLVSHALPRFAADHPELNLVLEVIQYEHLLGELEAGRVDIGYFVSDGLALEVESRRVRTEPMGLFVAPSHPLASVAVASPDQLRSQACISLPANSHLRTVIDRALVRAGLPLMPMSMESDQVDLVKQAAMLGLGASWLFRMSAVEDCRTGRLKEVRLPAEVRIEIHEVIAPRRRRDQQIQSVIDYLEQNVFSRTGDPRTP